MSRRPDLLQDPVRSGQWVLRRRVVGRPSLDDAELVEVEVGLPSPGWVRVANDVMSVEPYMRGRMGGPANYADPYQLGEPMLGPAVGRVTASADPTLPVGTLVRHDCGWREHAVVPAAECVVLGETGLPSSVHLGVLGIPGMTAWVGMRKIACVREGDVVFVSSAAGAVGSVAVQLAKASGCTVIGSAGSPEKVAMLRDVLQVDAAFDYHDGPVSQLLRTALAEVGAQGLDAYFDNVGGDQLEAAIRFLNDRARIALCGMISMYNNTEKVPGPANLIRLVWRRARMEGFLLHDHLADRPRFEAELTGSLRAGEITPIETSVPGGIDAAFTAFLDMLDGRGMGKTVIPFGRP